MAVVRIHNKTCFVCQGDVTLGSSLLTLMTCGHAIHSQCVSEGIQCLLCNQKRNDDDDDDDDGDYFTPDGKSAADLEIRNVPPQSIGKVRRVTHLTPGQYHNLVNGKMDPSLSLSVKIDSSFIKRNGITIDTLLEAEITLEEIHSVIGIKTWSELVKDLKLTRNHLKKKRSISPAALITLYSMTYDMMSQDLGVNLEYLSECRYNSAQLSAIGLTIESMINNYGLNKLSFIKFGLSIEDWKARLYLRKRHLKQLNLYGRDFDSMGWKSFTVISSFNLSPEETRSMGIRSVGSVYF